MLSPSASDTASALLSHVRLCGVHSGETGALWYVPRKTVDRGFSTSFSFYAPRAREAFRRTDLFAAAQTQREALAFVVQNSGMPALAYFNADAPEPSLTGLANAITVEIAMESVRAPTGERRTCTVGVYFFSADNASASARMQRVDLNLDAPLVPQM
jgi:hypothetical protein